MVQEVVQVQFKSFEEIGGYDISEFGMVAVLTEGGQGHHFEFIAVSGKTEILSESRVKDSQGERKFNLSKCRKFSPLAESPFGADKIAEAVNRKEGRLLKRGCEKGACPVGKMVFNVIDFRL